MQNKLFGSVVEPCIADWDKMEGDERIRFCAACKMNVFNISEMTGDEAAEILSKPKARTCVVMSKRDDGSIYTDNCPYRLRKVRNFLKAYAPAALAICYALFSQSAADAQGLVGAPVCGRYGQSNEVSNRYDAMGDSLRTGVTILTAITGLSAFPAALWKRLRTRSIAVRLMLEKNISLSGTRRFIKQQQLISLALLFAPLMVFLTGTWLVDSLVNSFDYYEGCKSALALYTCITFALSLLNLGAAFVCSRNASLKAADSDDIQNLAQARQATQRFRTALLVTISVPPAIYLTGALALEAFLGLNFGL